MLGRKIFLWDFFWHPMGKLVFGCKNACVKILELEVNRNTFRIEVKVCRKTQKTYIFEKNVEKNFGLFLLASYGKTCRWV